MDWERVASSIDADGYARVGPLLDRRSCAAVVAGYSDDRLFRKRINMDSHAYGSGDYAYYAEPLPNDITTLRERMYEGLAPIATAMNKRLERPGRFPPALASYRNRCARAGQKRPTPLVLRYGEGGYNRLHRDLYGELFFPLQLTLMLSRPREDFDGGQFLLVENRPRQQSIGTAIDLEQGEAVVFPVADRPVQGTRGILRAELRHGVSRVQRGERYALGIIFHDAA